MEIKKIIQRLRDIESNIEFDRYTMENIETLIKDLEKEK